MKIEIDIQITWYNHKKDLILLKANKSVIGTWSKDQFSLDENVECYLTDTQINNIKSEVELFAKS